MTRSFVYHIFLCSQTWVSISNLYIFKTLLHKPERKLIQNLELKNVLRDCSDFTVEILSFRLVNEISEIHLHK